MSQRTLTIRFQVGQKMPVFEKYLKTEEKMNEKNTRQENTEEFNNELQQTTQENTL